MYFDMTRAQLTLKLSLLALLRSVRGVCYEESARSQVAAVLALTLKTVMCITTWESGLGSTLLSCNTHASSSMCLMQPYIVVTLSLQAAFFVLQNSKNSTTGFTGEK